MALKFFGFLAVVSAKFHQATCTGPVIKAAYLPIQKQNTETMNLKRVKKVKVKL